MADGGGGRVCSAKKSIVCNFFASKNDILVTGVQESGGFVFEKKA